jgi:hypothetical protein
MKTAPGDGRICKHALEGAAMKCLRPVVFALALGLGLSILGLLARSAHAHGGLPSSHQILRNPQTDTYYVNVLYWGIWVGKPGGPWEVLCEEDINGNRLRRIGVSADGVIYATDLQGVTVSSDRGCSFKQTTGELATLPSTDVATDPQDGAVAYATTAASGAAMNGLFVTRDRGSSFMRVAGLAAPVGRQFLSVRIAPSTPRAIYVTSRLSATPYAPMIHRSTDGGNTFTDLPISYQLDGATTPLVTEVLAVDPRNTLVVYVRAYSETRHALLRSTDGGATFTEILKQDGVSAPLGQSRGIDDVAIDTVRGQLFVATATGLYKGADPGGAATLLLQKTGNLSQARCVAIHDGAVLACSSQFAPDSAAVGRSSDGTAPFESVLDYAQTAGPLDCPVGTPVGDNCPTTWQMYKSQLGVGVPSGDGGTGPAPMEDPGGGCGCVLGRSVENRAAGALAAIAAALALTAYHRRRRRDYLLTEK